MSGLLYVVERLPSFFAGLTELRLKFLKAGDQSLEVVSVRPVATASCSLWDTLHEPGGLSHV